MYLLDSDIIIWVLRNNPEIVNYVSELKNKFPVGISAITIAEVYMNIRSSEISVTEEYLSQNRLFQVTKRIAQEGGLYWNQYHIKLAKLGITDCLIAATAKIYDLTLITLNTRHFPMSDIKVVNPLK